MPQKHVPELEPPSSQVLLEFENGLERDPNAQVHCDISEESAGRAESESVRHPLIKCLGNFGGPNNTLSWERSRHFEEVSPPNFARSTSSLSKVNVTVRTRRTSIPAILCRAYEASCRRTLATSLRQEVSCRYNGQRVAQVG